MAQTTALKRRITSVKNTKQITKAMELVSASKMRRAQDAALRTRDYRNLARSILLRLRERASVHKHPLYVVRPIETKLYVLVTSDRGLAGAYNSNLMREFTNQLRVDQVSHVTSQAIVIGKQGARFVSRFENLEVIGVYGGFPEHPTANDIRPILDTIVESYTTKSVDAVDVLYTDYKSSINQIVTSDRLLPAAFTDEPENNEQDADVFEPSAGAVLNNVTERLIEAQLNQALFESQASEQSMRMLAMKNATDNASEIIDDLTLAFNTARQAAITQELAEITGGAEAIK